MEITDTERGRGYYENKDKDRGRSRSRDKTIISEDEVFAKEIEARQTEEESEEEEATHVGCFLVAEPDSSVIDMMNSLLFKFKSDTWSLIPSSIQTIFTRQPETIIPVLLISLHGGLPVECKNGKRQTIPQYSFKYKSFQAKSSFTRLIKSPASCCSFIRYGVRTDYLNAVSHILKKITPVTSTNIGSVITKIEPALRKLSFDLFEECRPLPESKKMSRTVSVSKGIFPCSLQTFEKVENEQDDYMINKLWTFDSYKTGDELNPNHKLNARGIMFCNDVVITVPDDWQPRLYDIYKFGNISVNNHKLRFELIKNRGVQYQTNEYQIGIYDAATRTIRYPAGTNLLSCLYFMQFVSERLGDEFIGLNNSLALGEENKLLIPMVIEITVEILYWYLCKQHFLSIDMSCESFMFYDEDGLYIPVEARKILKQREYKTVLNNLYNAVMPNGNGKRMRGGKHRKRYNTKKHKTKKHKKRGNTKKHKKYQKHRK